MGVGVELLWYISGQTVCRQSVVYNFFYWQLCCHESMDVVQTSWSWIHHLDDWRLSSYHPSQRNVIWPICRFLPNLLLAGMHFWPAHVVAVFGQTQIGRFQPNASRPFSTKRKLAVFGQNFWPMSCLGQKTMCVRVQTTINVVYDWRGATPYCWVGSDGFRDCDEGVALHSKG